MKRLILIIIFAASSINVSAVEKIRFGISATYPPFEFLDSGDEIVGFDIDLAKSLCKEMKISCIFINHAFDSLIPSLKYRKYDAVISGMDITSERSKQVAFTEPYYLNSTAIIIRKQTKSLNKSKDLKNKRVGVENGSTYQRYLQDKYPEVNTVAYDSYQNAIIDLKNGRIDGVFGDKDAVNEWLKTNPKLLTIASEKITGLKHLGVGFGIAVRSDNKTLLNKLNKALKEVKNDGTLKIIKEKWFP